MSINVIIPAYNAEHYIEDAVVSCVQDNVSRIIVVDDCSPDNLWLKGQEIVDRHKGKVVFARLSANGGQYVATNTGMNFLTDDCQFIAIQDADDISHPNRFRETLDAFNQDDKLQIVSGEMEHIDNYGNSINKSCKLDGVVKISSTTRDIESLGRGFAHVITNGVMTMKKSVIDEIGGFEPTYGGGDTQFIIRAYYSGMKMRNLRNTLGYRRMHSGSATHKGSMDPTRNAYRQKCSSEWLYWKLLKQKGKLKNYHLHREIIKIDVSDTLE